VLAPALVQDVLPPSPVQAVLAPALVQDVLPPSLM
jgi:hypothetical protein